jgi:hypothetical protein
MHWERQQNAEEVSGIRRLTAKASQKRGLGAKENARIAGFGGEHPAPFLRNGQEGVRTPKRRFHAGDVVRFSAMGACYEHHGRFPDA